MLSWQISTAQTPLKKERSKERNSRFYIPLKGIYKNVIITRKEENTNSRLNGTKTVL